MMDPDGCRGFGGSDKDRLVEPKSTAEAGLRLEYTKLQGRGSSRYI